MIEIGKSALESAPQCLKYGGIIDHLGSDLYPGWEVTQRVFYSL